MRFSCCFKPTGKYGFENIKIKELTFLKSVESCLNS